MRRLCSFLVLVAAVVATSTPALAQGTTASLRVTVLDETAAVLPGAGVLLVGDDLVEHALQVDETGVASAAGLKPGVYTIGADYPGFRPSTGTLTLRRGANHTTITLAVAISEELTVEAVDASDRRDNGFTQTLSQEEVDGALRRSRRDGRPAGADGRPGRPDLRRRFPRRPPAAQGPDSADPLSQELLRRRVPRRRHGARRGHHQARHGRLAQPRQLRLPRHRRSTPATPSPALRCPNRSSACRSAARGRSSRARPASRSRRKAMPPTTHRPSSRPHPPATCATRCAGRTTS